MPGSSPFDLCTDAYGVVKRCDTSFSPAGVLPAGEVPQWRGGGWATWRYGSYSGSVPDSPIALPAGGYTAPVGVTAPEPTRGGFAVTAPGIAPAPVLDGSTAPGIGPPQPQIIPPAPPAPVSPPASGTAPLGVPWWLWGGLVAVLVLKR